MPRTRLINLRVWSWIRFGRQTKYGEKAAYLKAADREASFVIVLLLVLVLEKRTGGSGKTITSRSTSTITKESSVPG